jgi:hypothetical protein
MVGFSIAEEVSILTATIRSIGALVFVLSYAEMSSTQKNFLKPVFKLIANWISKAPPYAPLLGLAMLIQAPAMLSFFH